MRRYCLGLDLKNDPQLIAEYDNWHKAENGWPEIRKSIFDNGILSMEIYRLSNRLFMIIETTDDFSFEHKAQMDATNEKVQEWETLMWQYQQALPWAKPGEKWMLSEKIFDLKHQST